MYVALVTFCINNSLIFYSYIEQMFIGISLLQGIKDLDDSIAGILMAY